MTEASDRSTRLVHQVLDEISDHRWLNLHVPHGFTVEDVHVEEGNPAHGDFASRRVVARLDVPVVYTPRNGRASKVWLGNLINLRSWISQLAGTSGPGALIDWQVEHDSKLSPRHHPPDPDRAWAITATFTAA